MQLHQKIEFIVTSIFDLFDACNIYLLNSKEIVTCIYFLFVHDSV